MNIEKAIEQLKSIQEDRKSFVEDDAEHDSIFMQDFEAIETVLQELERLQKENEDLKEIDLTTVHIKGVCDEKERWRNKIKEKIEQLKNEISYIAGECDEGCNKCFDKDWKPLYRGANFNFCYAYHQIKVLQDLLKEE